VINLAEVQLFHLGVQIPSNLLTFTLSSVHPEFPAANCNDGIFNNFCHSSENGEPNPTLTIVSAVAFDKVVVYNRQAHQQRIQGATITATVDGISQSTTFPSPDQVFTFGWSSSALVLYTPVPSQLPTTVPPTIVPTGKYNTDSSLLLS
jgi:hypothetical protein